MNYRHEFHAGNFADVVKHLALTAILLHLKKKDTPFAVMDTHAGRGLYALTGARAARTKEFESGIARLEGLEDGPASLRAYLKCVAQAGKGNYPGSPLIAAGLLRAQDRLVAIEKHPEEAAALALTLEPFAKARVVLGDGYARLAALLPPPERRGLVLIDPPYESKSEFEDVARAVATVLRRFATGIVLVWFPLKTRSEADAFSGEVLATGVRKLLRIEIESETAPSDDRMTAAGILVVNPPYGFDSEMREALALVAPRLGRETGSEARANLVWLADEA